MPKIRRIMAMWLVSPVSASIATNTLVPYSEYSSVSHIANMSWQSLRSTYCRSGVVQLQGHPNQHSKLPIRPRPKAWRSRRQNSTTWAASPRFCKSVALKQFLSGYDKKKRWFVVLCYCGSCKLDLADGFVALEYR